VVNTVEMRNTNAPVCCGQHMPIVIKSAPYSYIDREVRYVCPVTNAEVTTRRQRNEIMARENLIDANDFARTFEQRKEAEDTNKAELKAIRDALPKQLQEHQERAQKQTEQQFLDSVQ
jgi:hypothetical protein